MARDGEKIIILIGRSMSGKTTLCQRLMQETPRYAKTQSIHVIDKKMIDTPGEYLERGAMYGALMTASADADLIVFVQDAMERGTMFPPAFTSMFAKPVVGVVTKKDLANDEDIKRAKNYINLAGARKIFVVSGMTGEGVVELARYLGYKGCADESSCEAGDMNGFESCYSGRRAHHQDGSSRTPR